MLMASMMIAILPSGFMHYTTAVSRGMSDDPNIFGVTVFVNARYDYTDLISERFFFLFGSAVSVD
jgi:hypothetical protein